MQKTDLSNPMHEYCLFFEAENSPDDLLLSVFLSRSFYIGKSSAKIKKLFSEIYLLYQDDSLFSAHQAALLVEMLMLELAAVYEPQIKSIKAKPDISVTHDTVTTDAFFLFNLKDLTLEGLAKALGLSERQTQRTLLKTTAGRFSKRSVRLSLSTQRCFWRLQMQASCRLRRSADFAAARRFATFLKSMPPARQTSTEKASAQKMSQSAAVKIRVLQAHVLKTHAFQYICSSSQ